MPKFNGQAKFYRSGQHDVICPWPWYSVPIGKVMLVPILSSAELGRTIRAARQAQALTLEDVALAAGVGIRFVSELERGKPSARMAEAMRVLAAVGVHLIAEVPDDRSSP